MRNQKSFSFKKWSETSLLDQVSDLISHSESPKLTNSFFQVQAAYYTSTLALNARKVAMESVRQAPQLLATSNKNSALIEASTLQSRANQLTDQAYNTNEKAAQFFFDFFILLEDRAKIVESYQDLTQDTAPQVQKYIESVTSLQAQAEKIPYSQATYHIKQLLSSEVTSAKQLETSLLQEEASRKEKRSHSSPVLFKKTKFTDGKKRAQELKVDYQSRLDAGL